MNVPEASDLDKVTTELVTRPTGWPPGRRPSSSLSAHTKHGACQWHVGTTPRCGGCGTSVYVVGCMDLYTGQSRGCYPPREIGAAPDPSGWELWASAVVRQLKQVLTAAFGTCGSPRSAAPGSAARTPSGSVCLCRLPCRSLGFGFFVCAIWREWSLLWEGIGCAPESVLQDPAPPADAAPGPAGPGTEPPLGLRWRQRR
jgi:hypothetical protein